jgi:hypothetical protein
VLERGARKECVSVCGVCVCVSVRKRDRERVREKERERELTRGMGSVRYRQSVFCASIDSQIFT